MYIYEKQCNKIKIQRQVKSTKSGNKRGGGGGWSFKTCAFVTSMPTYLKFLFVKSSSTIRKFTGQDLYIHPI